MNERETLKQTVLAIAGANPRKCMKCGKCTGACPAFDEMEVPPHRFVSMVEEGRVEELLGTRSLWLCLTCFACVERCPRGVVPARFIEAVRLVQVRCQGQNHLKAEQIPDALDEELPQQAIVSAFRKYSK